MRARTRLAIVALAAVAFAFVAASAPAGATPPPAFTCLSGQITSVPGGAYSSLTIQPGALCFIDSGAVTVLNPIIIGDSAALGVFDGNSLNASASVTVGPNAFFGDVSGNPPITVGGGLTVQANGAVSIGFEDPFAPLVSAIYGGVRASDASTVQIHNSRVTGGVNLQGGGGTNAILDQFAGGGYNFNDLEDNMISGPVTEQNYSGIWAGVIRNHISGGLTFTGNTNFDEFDVGSNTIAGNANCSGNNPAVNTGGSPGSPNTVTAHNTCG